MSTFLDTLYGSIIQDGRWVMYLQGLQMTIMIAVVACLIGIVLGLLTATIKVYALGSTNPVLRVLNQIANLYTTVIRGTPIVVQLLILYRLAFMPNGEIACFIGFGINSGAYVSEIFRGGINSVDSGQMEAGRSLGLNRNMTMQYIILPQALKNSVPALFNEFIALVKETSVAGYIAVNDLTKMSNAIRNRTYNSVALYVAAALYLILTVCLTAVQKRVERRYARSDRS